MRIISFIMGLLAAFGILLAKPDLPESASKNHFEKRDELITLHSKFYSPSESRKYLSRNLQRDGVQPIELRIENHSNKTYSFHKELLSFEVHEAEKLPRAVYKDALPRSLSMSVASFFFFPITALSAIDSVVTYHTYSSLKHDLTQKELSSRDMILPHSSMTRVIFVSFKDVDRVKALHLLGEKGETVELPLR